MKTPAYPLTLLYDRDQRVRFEDISAPGFDAGYAWFARHRNGISRVASPLIEHIAAARKARRMQRCAGGPASAENKRSRS
jgi:hypothetical protein